MRRQQVRLVVLLGAISVIGIISAQAYFLFEAWSTREKQLNQSISIALITVAHKISGLNQSVPSSQNPVRQMTSNYYVVDVNTEIDADVLEHYLKSEFQRLNIHTDYEYAIYDCETDRMVYGDYIAGGDHQPAPGAGKNLPKYTGYLYYFGIHFPALRNTIAAEMTVFFFFSGVLLVLVVFFVYAIFVILQQKRFSEMQKDFINNMTHEFKTPLSSIAISAGIISEPGIVSQPERLAVYGNIISNETSRLNLLVDKVLQVARFEKGGVHLRRERVELNQLIRAVAENFCAGKPDGFRIVVKTEEDTAEVSADLTHVTNILYNLIDNAIKYTGKQPEIIIGTRRLNGSIILSVSDNGPGIPEKYRARVFRKFYRLPSGDVHNVKGFGLGLYYVRNICRAHRWKISLTAGERGGACFEIEIPV